MNSSDKVCGGKMLSKRIVRATLAVAVAGVLTLFGMMTGSRRVHADDSDTDQNLAAIGMSIAPSFINAAGKDPTLVGLGSFLVNGVGDCNGCHGSDSTNEYLPNNNPYFLPPNTFPFVYTQAQFNPATYLNGGQNFGPAGPGMVSDPNSPLYAGEGLGPNLITRNLTPDKTGNPAGGITLANFTTIMRTGHDFDGLHLNCSATVADNCYFAPVNGALLQAMPWAKFSSLTNYQIQAIWTYLSTVPCNAHNDALGQQFPWLQNTCQ
jgi:hypothetical protein